MFFSQFFKISFLRSICHETSTNDIGNFLLKKIMFCWVNINFWRGRVEGGHNGETNFIDFFHVSHHLEQFGRSFIFSKKIVEKLII